MSAPYPPPVPYGAPQRTNSLAVVTLVLGLFGFAVVPVVTGHLALRQIRERGEGGTALAVIGLVLGYLAVAGYALLLVVVVVAAVVGSRS